MHLSKRSYPHPVLGNADDVPGYAFQATLTHSRSPAQEVWEVEINCSCPSLLKLVKAGKATFSLHVECGHTLFRRAFTSAEAKWQVAIPADRLAGMVEVCPFVLATAPIRRYAVDGANPRRYEGATFAVEPGDVLAVGDCPPFHLDPRDPLARIGSIFHTQRSKEPGDRPVEANTLGDKIVLTLSQPDADQYALLRANPALKTLAANLFVLPALVQAVSELADEERRAELAGAYKWADVIRRKMEE